MSAGQTGTLAFAKLTPAADIYSLAKSVYTLLAGEAPRAYANETITGVPESVSGQEWSDELIRVLKRATNRDPRERHQTVDELWADLSGIREMAGDGEFSTVVASAIDAPQPHVSRGYTPIAPERPSFEAIAETPSSMPPLLLYMRPAYTKPVETPLVFQESKIVETKPDRNFTISLRNQAFRE